MQRDGVCRPSRLTHRWVHEMSAAIHRLCPSLSPVPRSTTDSDTMPEEVWNQYFNELASKHSQCLQNETVQKVLSYELDYNDLAKKHSGDSSHDDAENPFSPRPSPK